MKGLRWFANDDIPMNILSRLSAKTLHCFKYVSKEWYNLISDRSFVSSQLKRTEPASGFFFQEVFEWTDDDDIESVSYIPVGGESVSVWGTVLNFLPEKVVILSSNNGLLCCRSSLPTSKPRIYICNPLNKQWTGLPWPADLYLKCSISLCFDPFQNPIDSSTDFKLVAVTDSLDDEDDRCFFFDIYTSQTGSWRRSKECCCCNYNLTKNKGVLVDGVLYCLTDACELLSFDPQNEMSLLVMAPLPEAQFTSIPEMCIGESEGKLCYVIISQDGLQVWVLEDRFSHQWGLKFYVTLDELEKENTRFLYRISERVASRLSRDMVAWMDPLSFKDGMLLLRVSAKVFLYQFDSRRMKRLCDVSALGPKSMFSPIVVPYTMSLVPLGQD